MNRKEKPFPFIVCYPRSGSTLLRMMLDAHPDMAIPPETHFCDLFKFLSSSGPVTPALRSGLLQKIVQHPRWNDFNLSESEMSASIASVPEGASAGRCFAEFWKLYAEKQGKRRWGDKTPQHVICSAEIFSILPEAHFIHIVRDGRDVACSVRDSWFGSRMTISDIARGWVDRLSRFDADSQAFRHQTMVVRYEDLVSRPSETIADICKFIDIEYDNGMLSYYERARVRLQELRDLTVGTGVVSRELRTKIHKNVLLPPSEGSIGRWRSELDSASEKIFRDIAGEMQSRLGYY
ncbi:sulfotransferase [Mesorhizobium sp. BR1-1-3]|uniref:sulfotransferase family protein n=1 Tax=Mesorhizobium sp. BR1-1-3 TaxID=2876651 RepID=UPI001CD0DA5F|nr:sulfotransferase [Mesorhizobium sp. BR1-1-3]MBZ9888588.1 sulfotransferase [Mesorhizobium sp. BR1-1-3]